MPDQNKRILLLTNFLPPHRVLLLHELNKEINLRVLLSTEMEANRNWEVDWKDLDIKVQRTLTIPQIWRHPIGFKEIGYLHLPFDTLQLVREYAPDVIISAELGARSLGACIAAKRAGVPLIIWAKLSDHTEKGRGKIRQSLRRYILSRADAVLVNGEAGRRYIRMFGVAEGKFFNVPNATYLASYQKVEDISPASRRRILIVGSLQERKGLLPFLQAAVRWSERNPEKPFELVFAGSGSLRTRLEQYPHPDSIRLRFLGELPFDEIPSAFGQADLLAFPTLADEWGQVVNEALASGRPVLGSLYSQAVEELIVEGENGWVFHPDFPGEMDAALSRALAVSPETLQRMGRKARETASRVGTRVVLNQFLEVVDWCLNESC